MVTFATSIMAEKVNIRKWTRYRPGRKLRAVNMISPAKKSPTQTFVPRNRNHAPVYPSTHVTASTPSVNGRRSVLIPPVVAAS